MSSFFILIVVEVCQHVGPFVLIFMLLFWFCYCRVPETASVLLGGGVNFADLPSWAQMEFQVNFADLPSCAQMEFQVNFADLHSWA